MEDFELPGTRIGVVSGMLHSEGKSLERDLEREREREI